MPQKSLKKHTEEFLKYLKYKKRSNKTISNYDFYLNRFIEWFGNKKPNSITTQDIYKYKQWLNRLIDVHGDPLKNNTQNYHLIALRSFVRYLDKNNVNTINAKKIELMRMPKRRISLLEKNELNKLLEMPIIALKKATKNKLPNKILSQELIALRDKAILETLFSTGLRVSEIVKIMKKDIDYKKNMVAISGKRIRNRKLFLSEQAKHWIKKYIKLRKDKNPYIFISHDKRTGKLLNKGKVKNKPVIDKKPLTARSVQRTVEKYTKMTGINKEITPHTLRHSYAAQLLQSGADVRNVQDILGHLSITTTKVYSKMTNCKLPRKRKKRKNN